MSVEERLVTPAAEQLLIHLCESPVKDLNDLTDADNGSTIQCSIRSRSKVGSGANMCRPCSLDNEYAAHGQLDIICKHRLRYSRG